MDRHCFRLFVEIHCALTVHAQFFRYNARRTGVRSQVLYRPGWMKPANNNKNLSPSFVIPVRQIMAMFHLGHCHCIGPSVAVLFTFK